MGSSGLNLVFRRVPPDNRLAVWEEGLTWHEPLERQEELVRDNSVIVLDDDEEEESVDHRMKRFIQNNQRSMKTVEKSGNLEMCNAIYMDLDVVFEDDWERPPTCSCKAMPYDILGNV